MSDGLGTPGMQTSPMAIVEAPPVAPLDNNLLGESLADIGQADGPEPESPLQKRFKAPRDKDAWLYEPTHTYMVKGARVHNSVTKMIKAYWPQFQPELALSNYPKWKANKSSKYGMLIDYLSVVEERDDDYCKQAIVALWKRKGEIASRLGTDMHRDFQYICEGKDPPQGETDEVKVFRKWFQPFLNHYNLEPWRAEWIIYYEHEGRCTVAGQVDLVLKHRTKEEYWCIDYKRKDPSPKYPGGPQLILGNERGRSFGNETGSGPFKELPHNDFSVYTTQLNAYGHIAATQYGIDFRDRMCLLQIHPSLGGPNLVRVERMDDVMEELFALEVTSMPKSDSATELF